MHKQAYTTALRVVCTRPPRSEEVTVYVPVGSPSPCIEIAAFSVRKDGNQRLPAAWHQQRALFDKGERRFSRADPGCGISERRICAKKVVIRIAKGRSLRESGALCDETSQAVSDLQVS